MTPRERRSTLTHDEQVFLLVLHAIAEHDPERAPAVAGWTVAVYQQMVYAWVPGTLSWVLLPAGEA